MTTSNFIKLPGNITIDLARIESVEAPIRERPNWEVYFYKITMISGQTISIRDDEKGTHSYMKLLQLISCIDLDDIDFP